MASEYYSSELSEWALSDSTEKDGEDILRKWRESRNSRRYVSAADSSLGERSVGVLDSYGACSSGGATYGSVGDGRDRECVEGIGLGMESVVKPEMVDSGCNTDFNLTDVCLDQSSFDVGTNTELIDEFTRQVGTAVLGFFSYGICFNQIFYD